MIRSCKPFAVQPIARVCANQGWSYDIDSMTFMPRLEWPIIHDVLTNARDAAYSITKPPYTIPEVLVFQTRIVCPIRSEDSENQKGGKYSVSVVWR